MFLCIDKILFKLNQKQFFMEKIKCFLSMDQFLYTNMIRIQFSGSV